MPMKKAGEKNLCLVLKQAIMQAQTGVFGKSVVKPNEIILSHPAEEQFGDYATNIALQMFGKLKNNLTMRQFNHADELAEAIKSELEKQKVDFIERIEVVNGFLNIWIKNDYLVRQIKRVLRAKEEYGANTFGRGKKVMVEFAHPNTHKLFHIGHLRNITTGETIVRILEANGFAVIRANYQGDIGLHIAKCLFGILSHSREGGSLDRFRLRPGTTKAQILAKKIEFLGKCYVKGNEAYESDEKAKKEIIRINKKIYDKTDEKINQLWKTTRQWSLEYFERIYQRVGSHFDRLYFESEVFQLGKEIVEKFLAKGVFVRSHGAVIFPGSKFGLHDRVFINSENYATYEGKDIGLAKLQFEEYKLDLVIHVVAPEQTGYFQVLLKALEAVFPKTKGRELHLKYGWVRLKKGKMSSRAGNVVLGEWLLDEAKAKVKKIMAKTIKGRLRETEIESVAEAVAVGAVKYSFLKSGIDKDLAFDFDESVSFEGNSGPYLQYTYARAQSVLRQFETLNSKHEVDSALQETKSKKSKKLQNLDFEIDLSDLNAEELKILRWLYRYPEIVAQTGKGYAPSLICNFLYELAQRFNTFYNRHRILPKESQAGAKGQSPMIENHLRVGLTAAVAQVMKNGLNLLGIKAPEKM